MKKYLNILAPVTTISLLAVTLAIIPNAKKEKASAYSVSELPTTIDLNDSTASEIRSYYSSLNSLGTTQRKGTNLLKNLKTILKNGQKYYSYDTDNNGRKIWQIYEIADRDWAKSPASQISGYNSSTNKITNYSFGSSASNNNGNPYIHALYVNRSVDNKMHAWAKEGTTTSNHGTNAEWCIDREHVWAKSQGFEAEGAGGARGDPMHLMPGDSDVNSSLHSNFHYGFVDMSNLGTAAKWSYASNNYVGSSSTLGSGTVFEPQDCDKGDIARAIFYMVARYNYLSGSDSDGIDSNNPNLTLMQGNTVYSSYTSSTSNEGKMGVLTDLLEWHHLDPVDEYEIHRNNLLYKNFTNNRNPFIDFPEWVDYIWGTATYNGRNYVSYSSTPTGYATPSSDTINGYKANVSVTGVSLNKSSTTLTVGETETLTATITPENATNQSVSWTSSNSSIASVDSDGVVTANAAGTATITVSTTDGNKTATCTVTVQNPVIHVSSVSLNKSSMSLTVGGNEILTATVIPSDANDKSISWSSSNTSVATVNSSGKVTAVAAGSATITVSTTDGNKTATCTVTVSSGGSGGQTVTNAYLYSGTIKEDDYVIVYDGKAMKNVVSSNRLSYDEVTIEGNSISVSDISSSIIWHIAKVGDYWTIHNSDVDKDVASTGTKNQAALVTITSENLDNCRWTISGTSIYEFVNKANSDAGINCNLRNNGSYGFACYATATGGALSLYRVVETQVQEITSITATPNKEFSVGETITKSDITVKDNYNRTITDFEFASNNYQFTYDDAASGGALTDKQFTVSYSGFSANFNAQVRRTAYVASPTITSTINQFSGITETSASTATTQTFVVDEITYTSTLSYKYSNMLSFKTYKPDSSVNLYATDSVFSNTTKFSSHIIDVDLTLGGTNKPTIDATIEYSPDKSDSSWSTTNSGNAYYFRIRYVGTFTGYVNISSIVVTLEGEETATNVANYIMYEDTNNQCETKLNQAVIYLGNMSTSERNTFKTSTSLVISTARERLQAWAVSQSKTLSIDNATLNTSNDLIGVQTDGSLSLIFIISISTLSAAAFFSFLKKKREQE